MNRKGMTMEGAIVTIILFGVIMIAMIMIYKYTFAFGKAQFSKDECQASLLLTRAADLKSDTLCIKEMDNPVPIKCSREFVTVTDKGASQENVLRSYDYTCPQGFSAPSCAGHAVIADQMATCWDTFFQGEQLVFQQMEKSDLKFWQQNDKKTACFVCSEITLRTDADVQNFIDYTQKARWKKNSTYYDLFNARKAWCASEYRDSPQQACWNEYAAEMKPPIEQNTFKKGQKYAVVFMRHNMQVCVGGSSPSTDAQATLTVQTILADDISKYCDTVIV